MDRSLTRTLVSVLLAGAVAVTATPAYAAPKKTAKVRTAPKPPRPARYVVVGTLSAVDGSTITLSPTTGGNAKTTPAPVTLTVADTATVIRDDAPATLAGLVAGDHVAASGTRTGATVTITKVVATSPVPEPEIVTVP